jgi:hypothetical protein
VTLAAFGYPVDALYGFIAPNTIKKMTDIADIGWNGDDRSKFTVMILTILN